MFARLFRPYSWSEVIQQSATAVRPKLLVADCE
jgi:hypothetical protein